MREVHPGHIHPVLDELQQRLRVAADGADGANNTGQSHLVSGGVHVQVGNIPTGRVLLTLQVQTRAAEFRAVERHKKMLVYVLDVGAGGTRLLLARGDIHLLQDGLKRLKKIKKGEDEHFI